ncbi:CapA family protein [Oceanobacillus bengalensis]|uniref:CapA family protein n=1 Tax=Oceanobacillus bengalensis TaxID=1435466 RepID=A0A494YSF1_9BACI|nr:CapA family protein [Oceanobacillus bengalensis]RKQ12823.1 CapA family protein [Oceanobacillus bengalensis]
MDRVKRWRVFLLFLITLFLTACGVEDDVIRSSVQSPLKEVSLEPKEHQTYEQEITLSAIGDILIHSPVFKDAMGKSGYDFTPMLDRVKDFLSRSTITIANQETMIGGVELGLSSYPSFNSPQEVGDALKQVGVDVVTLANNHTLDRGEAAIQSALKHWETIDMMYAGAYKDQMDRENLRIYETEEGISTAFLSYTYGTNGIPVPDGKDYLVNLIDKEKIGKEIQLAKEEADVIVLSLHFGNEYERMPNEVQKDLVQYAADQGVHVVIGHHPHVLQPVDWVTGENGNKTLVAYSLGNFLSNQQELYQRIGGIFNFSVKKVSKGEEVDVEVHSPSFIPTYVTFTPYFSNYEVVPMYQLTNTELSGAENIYQEIKAHMSRWVPELAFPEE